MLLNPSAFLLKTLRLHIAGFLLLLFCRVFLETTVKIDASPVWTDCALKYIGMDTTVALTHCLQFISGLGLSLYWDKLFLRSMALGMRRLRADDNSSRFWVTNAWRSSTFPSSLTYLTRKYNCATIIVPEDCEYAAGTRGCSYESRRTSWGSFEAGTYARHLIFDVVSTALVCR